MPLDTLLGHCRALLLGARPSFRPAQEQTQVRNLDEGKGLPVGASDPPGSRVLVSLLVQIRRCPSRRPVSSLREISALPTVSGVRLPTPSCSPSQQPRPPAYDIRVAAWPVSSQGPRVPVAGREPVYRASVPALEGAALGCLDDLGSLVPLDIGVLLLQPPLEGTAGGCPSQEHFQSHLSLGLFLPPANGAFQFPSPFTPPPSPPAGPHGLIMGEHSMLVTSPLPQPRLDSAPSSLT